MDEVVKNSLFLLALPAIAGLIVLIFGTQFTG